MQSVRYECTAGLFNLLATRRHSVRAYAGFLLKYHHVRIAVLLQSVLEVEHDDIHHVTVPVLAAHVRVKVAAPTDHAVL